MPQLEAYTFMPQLIWLGITFFALFIVMSRVILPRVAGIIEERQDRIADDIDRAEQFRNEAQEALEAYEKSLAEARGRAMAIASDTRDQVKAETDKLKKNADEQIAMRLKEAEESIQATKEEALAHVTDVAAETAREIVKRLIGVEIDEAAAKSTVSNQLSNNR